MLSPDQLRAIDRVLLTYLREQPVTPAYCRKRYVEEYSKDDGEHYREQFVQESKPNDRLQDSYTRGYIHERLGKLAEHDYVVNQYNTGLYTLVKDPLAGEDES